MFYNLIKAYSSINYFTDKSYFTMNQMFCYIRKHRGYYYSIEKGNNDKLIQKLESKIKEKVNIKTGNGVKRYTLSSEIFFFVKKVLFKVFWK